jgi:hypothetical protein
MELFSMDCQDFIEYGFFTSKHYIKSVFHCGFIHMGKWFPSRMVDPQQSHSIASPVLGVVG